MPMDAPLTIEEYFFPIVQVVANHDIEQLEDINDIEYEIEVGISTGDIKGDYRLVVEILSKDQSKEEEKKLAYNIHLLVFGKFKVAPNWPEPEKLVLINGASILYSAAREFLITVSSRGPYGPLTLPAASFLKKYNESHSDDSVKESKKVKPQKADPKPHQSKKKRN